jgi:hypothetical protein
MPLPASEKAIPTDRKTAVKEDSCFSSVINENIYINNDRIFQYLQKTTCMISAGQLSYRHRQGRREVGNRPVRSEFREWVKRERQKGF